MRVALVDRKARIAYRRAAPTLAREGRDAVLQRLKAMLKDAASHAERQSLVGIGICLPGPVDPESAAVYNPPNLPGWDGFSPKPVLEAEFALQTSVGNDANLAALAEHRYGAGRGYKHMVYLTVSTGIGGGIIIGNRLYEGRKGFAGELGHMTIDRNGPRCNCGNLGCLEVMASGTAVASMARERLASGEASALRQRADGDALTARMVAEAAASWDKLAQAVIQEAATNLGIGIVSLLHAFDPEVIVIGGGMSNSLELLLPWVNQEIDRHAMGNHRGRRPVVKSALGDDASLIGAAALAFSAYHKAYIQLKRRPKSLG